MSVVPFRRRASAAIEYGLGPDEVRFGAWVCREVLRWMNRTPADLRRECEKYLSTEEIDDIEAQRHLSRRKVANG